MRALRIVGVAALLGWVSSSAGCAADDDAAPSAAGTGGATSTPSGGTGGGTGSGGTESATGGSDTASGGTSNGDAGTSSTDAGTSNGDAGTPSTDAGMPSDDANAGSGATDVVPYANVVSVVVASGSEGAYTYGVAIESADIDCTQYANWWEVLTEDGALRYRRILEHSHTDANGSSDADMPGNTFTRTGGPISVAADTVVLVRAHMSTGGYNGTVMRGSATQGFAQAPDIGPDFATERELDDPLPTGCEF